MHVLMPIPWAGRSTECALTKAGLDLSSENVCGCHRLAKQADAKLAEELTYICYEAALHTHTCKQETMLSTLVVRQGYKRTCCCLIF